MRHNYDVAGKCLIYLGISSDFEAKAEKAEQKAEQVIEMLWNIQ